MLRKVYAKVFKFKGGHVALDFANTAQWHATEAPIELVVTYDDLLNWSRKAELINSNLAARLARVAAAHPAEAQTTHQRAIQLRETIYRLFAAHAHQRAPNVSDLQALGAFTAESYARLRLQRSGAEYQWGWEADEEALDMMLWPIAQSAANLLTLEQLQRVGQCASDYG